MNLFSISWKYICHRPLVSSLTVLAVALGMALISATLGLRSATQEAFERESRLFDLVVGAKGSPLQLVLSSVYHLDIPTGNIPYKRYYILKNDSVVKEAYPIGLGDSYRGFRIVGTEKHIFELTERENENGSQTALLAFDEGSAFTEEMEAVLGYQVAKESGLSIGDSFLGNHGLSTAGNLEEHGESPFIVKGILEQSGTSLDRVILVPLISVWNVHGDRLSSQELSDLGVGIDLRLGSDAENSDDEDNWGFFARYAEGSEETGVNEEAIPDFGELEVTSVLIQLETPGMRLWLGDEINRNTEAMSAIPVSEMLRLYQRILKPLQQTLLAVALLIVITSTLTIVATLYQSTERRKKELAIMRALGAHSSEVFLIVLMEAFFLSLAGAATGIVLGHIATYIGAGMISDSTGLTINPFQLQTLELYAFLLITFCGSLSGVIPAFIAYRRSPDKDLSLS